MIAFGGRAGGSFEAAMIVVMVLAAIGIILVITTEIF
jgi:hypothetical protein